MYSFAITFRAWLEFAHTFVAVVKTVSFVEDLKGVQPGVIETEFITVEKMDMFNQSKKVNHECTHSISITSLSHPPT